MAPESIIHVEDAAFDTVELEQALFGGAVGSSVVVIVEVIPGEVGKHADGELHIVYPSLRERMRAGFQRHGLAAVVSQTSQPTLRSDGICGGEMRRLEIGRPAPANGSENARRHAHLRRNVGNVVGDRGLAVGSRDADTRQVAARMRVEPCRYRAAPRTQVCDQDHRDSQT